MRIRIWSKLYLNLFVLCGGLVAFPLSGQNLIPNGSFEQTAPFDYTDPASALSFLQDWYPPGNLTTPDLFDVNFPVPQTVDPNFWNIVLGTPAGIRYIGLANLLSLEGYRRPECLAVPLTSTLVPNQAYAVEMQVRNKGVAGFNGQSPRLCVIDNQKAVQVLLGKEDLTIIDDQQNKNSYPIAQTLLNLSSERITANSLSDWHPIGGCFIADGGESHLGLSLSTGPFEVEAPCTIAADHWDVFYVYYLDLDAITLHPLPAEYSLNLSLCQGEPKAINLEEVLDLPRMQQAPQYFWDLGHTGPTLTIAQAGIYSGYVQLDCTSIPFAIEVEVIPCEPAWYVPNVFSPNFDGINDHLHAYLESALNIQSAFFQIYDRWGNQVFSTSDLAQGWDGRWNKQAAQAGVYTWTLQFSWIDLEGQLLEAQETGTVFLLR